jgi:uncharacterized membrane protein
MMLGNSAAPRTERFEWAVPVALLALSLVPALAGIVRLAGLAAGHPATLNNARFVDMPLPVVVHILSALPFCALGAFQFSAVLRRRFPAWHRIAGRFLVLFGSMAAASGLWMTTMYSIDPDLQGPLLLFSRLLFGAGMLVSIALSLVSILRRDMARHRAWMIRAYALAQGAGTQVLLALPWLLIIGELGGRPRDLLMTLAWVINIALAEWIIHRHR